MGENNRPFWSSLTCLFCSSKFVRLTTFHILHSTPFVHLHICFFYGFSFTPYFFLFPNLCISLDLASLSLSYGLHTLPCWWPLLKQNSDLTPTSSSLFDKILYPFDNVCEWNLLCLYLLLPQEVVKSKMSSFWQSSRFYLNFVWLNISSFVFSHSHFSGDHCTFQTQVYPCMVPIL